MFHVESISVSELRQHFPRVEARLRRGETLEIRKHNKPLARLVPLSAKPPVRPDFEANAKRIFGERITKLTGTEIVAEERDRY